MYLLRTPAIAKLTVTAKPMLQVGTVLTLFTGMVAVQTFILRGTAAIRPRGKTFGFF